MNEILGDDYEKKLAAVSVLKQYAEDRDIDTLAKALCFILKTPKQRKLIDHIRYFKYRKRQSKFYSCHCTNIFHGKCSMVRLALNVRCAPRARA